MINLLKKVKRMLVTETVARKGSRTPCSAGVLSSNLVFDDLGHPQTLEKLLAKGGEGEVFLLEGKPRVLVKRYLPTVRVPGKRWKLTLAKLKIMTRMTKLSADPVYAWPKISVFDGRKESIGYAMRRLDGVHLQTLCNPMLFKERFPNWTRKDLVKVVLNFLEGVHKLHQNGCLIGDVNPANFLVDADQNVYFIDCDSYQIEDGGKSYPSPVGIPMYTAPEFQGLKFIDHPRTYESEYFSVAVLLFKILMLGRHPYDRIGGEDPVANMKAGKTPLGTGSGCKMPQGPWYNIWSHFPYAIKSLFIKTFKAGHLNPAQRPTLVEWLNAFKRYEGDLNRGFFNPAIMPSEPKSNEYKGKTSVKDEVVKKPLFTF